ncbi:hypothetical protein C8F04DRAFT_1269631 [Mycena alexandri]|uniref:Uncharacterized protein n=1 Tax=Mycena alexandri TaxID=1745969 RepID=A0AAD6SCH4_9AGAR|nr:hypothetical protein C8F04DRAFT_1269631 [Mycena alexandri]
MGKRKRARKPKEDRENLENWAEGARETILQPYLERYADACKLGWRYERKVHRHVCNEYHALISWRLKDHEEPDLPLLPFDPNARLLPDKKLDYEETQKRARRIKLLDKRIRRWPKYRVTKLRKHVRTRIDSHRDPWSVFLAQLSKIHAPPKARQAYQQYMKETGGTGASVPTEEPPVNFWASIARELFAALPQDTRDGYAARAKGQAHANREAYQKALKQPLSTAPKDRQPAIDNLGPFITPILQGIHERTGLHSIIILGGPIPQYGGDLRTVHVSYGRNRTAVGSHFPQWAKTRFNPVLGLMKEYLETVFSANHNDILFHMREAKEYIPLGPQDRLDAVLPTRAGTSAAGPLDGAKFTMDPSSDSESDSESESDSDSSDDGSELEEAGRPRKKSKVAAGQRPIAEKRPKMPNVLAAVGNTSSGSRGKGKGKKSSKKARAAQSFDDAPAPVPPPTHRGRGLHDSVYSGHRRLQASFQEGAPRFFGAINNAFSNSSLNGTLSSLERSFTRALGGVGTIDPASATINPSFLMLRPDVGTVPILQYSR